MRKKSVAVLDIRSSEICAVTAEKGVNNTFIIKSKYSRSYEGYAEGQILDVNDFISAIRDAAGSVIASSDGELKEFYVSLPDEFCETVQTDRVLSLRSTQRINARHVKALTNISVPNVGDGKSVIGCSALYYVLSDKRKVVDPIGMTSDSLRARLCFFVCGNVFLDLVVRAFKAFPSVRLFHWVPQNLSQALYLIDAEKRDGCAVMLDLGFISSTFSVVCGNGIAFSEAFSVGVGHIAVLLMEALDVPYEVALGLMRQVNLNARDRLPSYEEYNYNGERYRFQSSNIRELIREGLDGICSVCETCRQSYAAKDLSDVPVNLIGEGVGEIRGLVEHLASRLVTSVEVSAPKLPYYDKPHYSSLFSLLSAALDGNGLY